MPPDPAQMSTPSSSTLPPQNSKETEVDKSAKQVPQPIIPFPNRLRSNNNANMEKMFEVFNQVRLNIPLLDAIQ